MELLADKPEDDKAGQVAAQGFTYQEWYAVLLIAELLEKEDDFAVGMEVKEDIAVLDSATAPTTVEFCQVKTNEQVIAWTFEELHKAPSRRLKDGTFPLSILAKLYKRRHQFAGAPTKLRFVTNTAIKLKETTGSVNLHEYRLESLAETAKKTVAAALARQLELDAGTITLDEIRLHRSDLPLGQQHLFISGKLSDLAHRRKFEFKVSQPAIAATMLASEMRKRGSNTGFASTFEELKTRRLMTRGDALQTLILVSEPPPGIDDIFKDVLSRLDAEDYDFAMVDDIRMQKVALLSAMSDRTNMLFKRQVTTLVDCYKPLKVERGPDTKKLGSFMERLTAEALKKNEQDFAAMEMPFIHALSLMVIRNGIDINVFTVATNSQLKGEE
ncbi:dsDNA nuclease domain-containing protein [Herbaspirillum camelliae]|uniref:dsDNA nuclease domain-containing protein n=1 Tax=Herbaspirillum camelliae TaxID=1892903 RepID=UPI00117B6C51|nr:dsDNA nuclease domain-containing protein [Herbaspirillum camelliae]